MGHLAKFVFSGLARPDGKLNKSLSAVRIASDVDDFPYDEILSGISVGQATHSYHAITMHLPYGEQTLAIHISHTAIRWQARHINGFQPMTVRTETATV